jgi:predicted membrane channel-forming protein YqfA (hemolysin III family)
MAVFAGRIDWFQEGQRFIKDHSTIVILLLTLTVPLVLYGVYLSWGKSALREIYLTRDAKLMTKFAPNYAKPRPLPLWVYMFLASWVGMVLLTVWELLHL